MQEQCKRNVREMSQVENQFRLYVDFNTRRAIKVVDDMECRLRLRTYIRLVLSGTFRKQDLSRA